MATKSSGFTLIELLVVVAILGILSAIGTISYTGYVAGAKKKAAENAMQQIGLAQTEEYSNSAEYYTQGEDCEPSAANSLDIELNLLNGSQVITKDSDYQMCIEEVGNGTSYIVIAAKVADGAVVADTQITMTANGVWGN
jgi:type IV pilus assembly protein PilE